MSNTEEVKTKIKQGKLDEAMTLAMIEAMKLEIVTNVSNVDDSCRTSLSLLENKIEHQLGSQNLQSFHFSEVEKAHSKILENVQNLQQMFTLLQDNLNKLQ